ESSLLWNTQHAVLRQSASPSQRIPFPTVCLNSSKRDAPHDSGRRRIATCRGAIAMWSKERRRINDD
ncbi:MAG TPA: hypothetical protein VGK58_07290, partial [Lacipirellulaceae bacterium]